jgi:hypothetical protein
MIRNPRRSRSDPKPTAGRWPPGARRHHHGTLEERQRHGWRAVHKEAEIGEAKWQEEQRWALEMGLSGAESLTDKTIPTFSRGELPHYAGINTFLKAPYVENVRDVAKFDAAVLGAPFDGGTTYRPGTRFGPQAMRRISALHDEATPPADGRFLATTIGDARYIELPAAHLSNIETAPAFTAALVDFLRD